MDVIESVIGPNKETVFNITQFGYPPTPNGKRPVYARIESYIRIASIGQVNGYYAIVMSQELAPSVETACYDPAKPVATMGDYLKNFHCILMDDLYSEYHTKDRKLHLDEMLRAHYQNISNVDNGIKSMSMKMSGGTFNQYVFGGNNFLYISRDYKPYPNFVNRQTLSMPVDAAVYSDIITTGLDQPVTLDNVIGAIRRFAEWCDRRVLKAQSQAEQFVQDVQEKSEELSDALVNWSADRDLKIEHGSAVVNYGIEFNIQIGFNRVYTSLSPEEVSRLTLNIEYNPLYDRFEIYKSFCGIKSPAGRLYFRKRHVHAMVVAVDGMISSIKYGADKASLLPPKDE